jgi:Uma2 family endonuclease
MRDRGLRPRTDLGTFLHAPSDVVLADDTVVQPDIFFFSKAREGLIGERRITGAPDLVIEILFESDPARDTVRKLAIYGRRGVREYWIVDPKARGIEVFVLEDAALVRRAAHSDGEVRSLEVLPGLVIPLAAVFAE